MFLKEYAQSAPCVQPSMHWTTTSRLHLGIPFYPYAEVYDMPLCTAGAEIDDEAQHC